MNIDDRFKNKKVLILGLGLNDGGVGAARFFAVNGAEVLVTDLRTEQELEPSLEKLNQFPDIKYHLGSHTNEDIDWADLIIRNPAIRPNNPYLLYAKEQAKQIEMDLGIFFEFVKPTQVIGVTGTKGKSTTASLIYELLKDRNHPVIFAGNIGKSLLDSISAITPESMVILELSSFQLQVCHDKKISPQTALITNIYPDHLNYHSSMEEYIEMKRSIIEFQDSNGQVFFRKGDEVTDTDQFKNNLGGHINLFSATDLPEDFKPELIGEHNLENIAGAIAVADSFGVPKESALEIAKNFKGVEFRLELIKEWMGIRIYNDTTSSNPQATLASLKILPNSIVIVGGMNKGMPYQELAEALDKTAKTVFFFEGDMVEEVKNLMTQKDKQRGTYNNFELLAEDIKAIARERDIILFSPAATSFNLFKNEFDRGRQFNEAIAKVFK